MKADAKTETEVMNGVKQAFKAFARKDLNALMASFAPEPDLVFIGTGGDEKGVGFDEVKAIFKRAFSQFDEASFDFGWHSVSVVGSLALLATDIALRLKAGEREVSSQIRLTSVLEKRGDEWLILQSHDSVPDRDQTEGEAFPSR